MASTPTSNARTWLITGATGFIGGHLIKAMRQRGDHIIALARNATRAQVQLGADVRVIGSLDELPGDAVMEGIVNLAGAPIFGAPWTQSRRKLLRDSRIRTTRDVVTLCARLARRPRVLVSGSAVGFYGVHGDEPLDESSPPQSIFQSELCRDWEAEAMKARGCGVRVVTLRTGVVLSGDGGALPRLAMPVRFYAGVILGDGRAWMSWIHIADLVALILFALDEPRCEGPINGTAPTPVTYGAFQRLLGRALSRPIWFNVPAFVLRAGVGEMSQMLVEGQRVLPRKAQQYGFNFQFTRAEDALIDIFGGSL